MSRLIDAKKLELQVKEAFKESPVIMGCMIRWIRKQPTVDAVEVVRCKECKYAYNMPLLICHLHYELYGDTVACVEPDDFCSYGERREND